MSITNTENIANLKDNDLQIVKKQYEKCGFEIENLNQHVESIEYGACSFMINGKTIQQRFSKITPTKTGQFVTIWQRNKDGITAPFDFNDNLDFIIVTSRSGDNFGQFIFPKSILADKGIISYKGKEGKRGIRVYPPWDIATNKQAKKTQNWQTKYFLTIKNDTSTDLELLKHLFRTSNNK